MSLNLDFKRLTNNCQNVLGIVPGFVINHGGKVLRVGARDFGRKLLERHLNVFSTPEAAYLEAEKLFKTFKAQKCNAVEIEVYFSETLGGTLVINFYC